MRSFTLAVLLLSPLACDLYGNDVCQRGAYGDLAPTGGSLRDPQTGRCEALPDSACNDPELIEDGNALLPDWAACGIYCEALTRTLCATTAGCRVIMQDTCPPLADCAGLSLVYAGCWGTAPSGPVAGDCDGLGAQGCSRHEACVAVHTSDFTDCSDPNICDPALGDFFYCTATP